MFGAKRARKKTALNPGTRASLAIVFPHCRANGRRTAVQMGGVLLGFPFKALKLGRYSDANGGRTAVQIGGVLQYFLRDQ